MDISDTSPTDLTAVAVEAEAEAEALPFELSVILPARNEADWLPACLASLLSQSEPGFELGVQWELILINDDSSDATGEIAAEAASDAAKAGNDKDKPQVITVRLRTAR